MVISLLMVSKGIIPFKKHIAAVGTTSNNMLSKRTTLDEGSLLLSKSETQHDHRFTSTPYVHMDSGIGPLFNSPCVQIVLVFVCIKWINIYLMHKNTLKASKSYIQERKRNKRKPKKEEVIILHEIRRPNSLKTVANCRNLPFGERATRGLTGASSMGGRCAESPPTFIRGKCRKNRKRMWSTNFKCERFGSCIYARGRY